MSTATTAPKRSRAFGDITANACRECRKKRAKCDGKNPCERCASREAVDCIYEDPVRVSKEDMRAEIEQLSRHRQLSEQLIDALARGGNTDHIIQALRQGKPLEKVLGDLDLNAQQHDATSQQHNPCQQFDTNPAIQYSLDAEKAPGYLPRLDFSDNMVLPNQPPLPSGITLDFGTLDLPSNSGLSNPRYYVGGSEDFIKLSSEAVSLPAPFVGNWNSRDMVNSIQIGRGQNHILGPSFGHEEHPRQILPREDGWTTVTTNISFIEHLLTLYFCWEYPTFASLSKEQFLMDFREKRQRYCSALVVNCLLALGSRFSTHPDARTSPQDSLSAGDNFFAEAKSLLDQQSEPNLLMVQALGLMSIRETSCGRNKDGWFYSGQSIRLAVELGLHKAVEGDSDIIVMENAVRSATFWGAFALDQAWCLAAGQVPHFSQLPHLISKPSVVDNVEATEWVPYSDDGMPVKHSYRQPSNIRSVLQSFCNLSEIIHKFLYVLYSPMAPLTSSRILSQYAELLRWYNSLPEALRLGQNYTPSVLFAHIYYHFTILLLFRPFIKVKFIGSPILPREICIQAADNILALVRSYNQLYTLRRTPSFMPYIVLTSSIIHLATTSFSGSSEELGGSSLKESTFYLKSMRECHSSAKRSLHIINNLAKNGGTGEDNDSGDEADPDDLYVQSLKAAEGIGESDLNPLFAPFSLHFKPLVAAQNLARDGFELI